MKMYVVLKMRKWESLEVELLPPFGPSYGINFTSPEGSPGFLPVFTDRERAVEYAGAGNEMFVREITEVAE